MSDIKMRARRSFEALKAGLPLARLIDDLMGNYPDPYTLANEQAQLILRKHTGKPIDPRFVWWHQFTTASSSPRSYTGWQHSGPPSTSINLVELVIQRFELRFQDAPDEIDMYGGFYKQGAHAQVFDERNEVPLLGSAVQADLWALDFAVLYRAQVERFWATYGDDFRVLAKVTLLAQARHAHRAGYIDGSDLARLRALVIGGLEPQQMPTLEQLRLRSTSNELIVRHYGFASPGRDCFYSLHAGNGRTLLWLPWSPQGLRGFANERAMAQWLRQQLNDSDTFAAYLDAAVDNPLEDAHLTEARGTLRSIADSPTDDAALAVLQYKHEQLEESVFARMAAQAGREMVHNAETMLSNADLRKAMFRGYLSVFLNLFVGFTPLGWPVALSILGATLVKVGLDLDAAARARDAQTRQEALRQAMLESLFGALYLADFGFQSSFALLAFQAPIHEARASLGQWRAVESPGRLLADLDVNDLVLSEVISEGPLRAIQVRADGSCWITMQGLTYRVRYSQELDTWLIVPPEDPFAFMPLRPVRADASGQWHLLEPPRLAGGGPPVIATMPNVRSSMWDEYVRIDSNSSQVMSARALWRQKRVLQGAGIPTLGATQVPDVDAHGLDCLLVDGAPRYTYRDANGRYYNALIEYYTDSDARINDVFRTGSYRYGDESDYIRDLTDSLERLPKSNEVTLYRGGRDARGTGGLHFRNGQIGIGDVLINTDFTSFTENPYMVPGFAADLISEGARHWRFDDSSVVFELPAGAYQDATPISAFSMYWDEAETLFLPGNCFRVDSLKQVYGEDYRFMLVSLRKVPQPASGPVYDLRTGQPFDRALFGQRLRNEALLERFFPSEPADVH